MKLFDNILLKSSKCAASSRRTMILVVFLMFNFLPIYAQPGFDDDVNDTPIDGGISLVILGGAAIGLAKKSREKVD